MLILPLVAEKKGNAVYFENIRLKSVLEAVLINPTLYPNSFPVV